MQFIDTHAHLDDDAFAPDLGQVLQASAEAGVQRVINIGYKPESWTASVDMAAVNPQLSYALGLHPNHADDWSTDLADDLNRLIRESRPVAIGETGLDYFRDHANRSSQRVAFRDQLYIARENQLPVVIHMRGDVENEIIDTLSDFRDVRIVFHSFDGSERLRDFGIGVDAYFGFGGLATKASSTGLCDVIRAIPLDRMLLETDSPFLSPNGWPSRRNSPESIPLIASQMAAMFGVSNERIAKVTTESAEALFGLSGVGGQRPRDAKAA